MASLITKVPSLINNENLLRIGEFCVHVKIAESSAMNTRLITLFNYETSSGVRIVGDGHFTDSSGSQNLGKSLNYNAASQAFYLSPGEYDVFIGDKYGIRTFSVGSNNLKGTKFISKGNFGFTESLVDMEISFLINEDGSRFDMSKVDTSSLKYLTMYNSDSSNTLKMKLTDLKNASNMIRMQFPNQLVDGNISVFAENKTLEFISISGNKLEGNISSFGKATKCTQIDIRNNAQINGSVESLFNSLFSNGKLSGVVNLFVSGTQCTLNGSVVQSAIKATFTSSGWSIA